jgi:hypothetical protein
MRSHACDGLRQNGGLGVDEHILISGRDTLLVAIPFVLMVVVGIFRLDRILGAPEFIPNRQRPACGIDEFGEPILRDPDGRLSGRR